MIIKAIDNQLNQITMYKLVITLLMTLFGFAMLFSGLGLLYLTPLSLMLSLLVLGSVSFTSNVLFSKLLNIPANHESSSITALILFFVMAPADNLTGFLSLGVVALIAVASKYILAPYKRHIFNPAALAAFLAPFFGLGIALWWVGSAVLLPFVVVVGLLIVRKIRRFQLFFSVILSSSIAVLILGYIRDVSSLEILSQHFFSWPIVFFASIMATEPLTTPPTRKWQIIYGMVVGALSSIPFSIGSIHNTPELSLLLGNLLAYSVSLRRRLILTLSNTKEIANQTYELVFKQESKLNFKAGQYLEWTLPHSKADSRGVRRYFTIASSPTEDELKLGVKSAEKMSTFKQNLISLKAGSKLVAGQLSGDFTLPKDLNEKLVFIAGGIGVTPFRSIVKYLIDTNEQRDIVLFYCSKTEADFAYKDIFQEAESKLKLKVIYIPTQPNTNWQGDSGYLTEELLKKHSPDYINRRHYISGPSSMVDAYKKMLVQAGVSRSKIVTDYFPGLA